MQGIRYRIMTPIFRSPTHVAVMAQYYFYPLLQVLSYSVLLRIRKGSACVWRCGTEVREAILVPVTDRTAVRLMTIIRDWVNPGTTVISDCWGA
jgi:hypothetical protein